LENNSERKRKGVKMKSELRVKTENQAMAKRDVRPVESIKNTGKSNKADTISVSAGKKEL